MRLRVNWSSINILSTKWNGKAKTGNPVSFMHSKSYFDLKKVRVFVEEQTVFVAHSSPASSKCL